MALSDNTLSFATVKKSAPIPIDAAHDREWYYLLPADVAPEAGVKGCRLTHQGYRIRIEKTMLGKSDHLPYDPSSCFRRTKLKPASSASAHNATTRGTESIFTSAARARPTTAAYQLTREKPYRIRGKETINKDYRPTLPFAASQRKKTSQLQRSPSLTEWQNIYSLAIRVYTDVPSRSST